jgi:SAM-dependent methyltransferase
VGLYGDRILPHLVDRVCGAGFLRPLRERACAGLTGEVLEIGFGSGQNVPFYPGAVTKVTAVEPSDVSWRLAQGRIRASRVPVVRSGLDGHSLPFADRTFDCALSTWTMCTIPDIATALLEVRRVLRAGGQLHFVEHGLAPDRGVQRWQRVLEPLQKRVAGGCHLTRPIATLVADAGFTITDLDVFYDSHAAKYLSAYSLGVATA